MANLRIIRDICKERKVSLRDLSREIGITENGLQLILKSNSAKFDIVEKIARFLKVNILVFVDNDISEFNSKQEARFDIPEYLLLDEKIYFLSKRHSKFTEIIQFYKDYYIFRITYAIVAGFDPEYKLPHKKESRKVFLNEVFKKMFRQVSIEVDLEQTPYSKLNAINKDIIDNTMVFDGFYFPIFDINFKNITEYLEDGMLDDPEILEYWNAWKSK